MTQAVTKDQHKLDYTELQIAALSCFRHLKDLHREYVSIGVPRDETSHSEATERLVGCVQLAQADGSGYVDPREHSASNP